MPPDVLHVGIADKSQERGFRERTVERTVCGTYGDSALITLSRTVTVHLSWRVDARDEECTVTVFAPEDRHTDRATLILAPRHRGCQPAPGPLTRSGGVGPCCTGPGDPGARDAESRSRVTS